MLCARARARARSLSPSTRRPLFAMNSRFYTAGEEREEQSVPYCIGDYSYQGYRDSLGMRDEGLGIGADVTPRAEISRDYL